MGAEHFHVNLQLFAEFVYTECRKWCYCYRI